MFPSDILKVAKVAIEHKEMYTLRFCINELWGWTESPDEETAKVAAYIGMGFHDLIKNNGSLEDLHTANSLMKYAVRVLKLENK